MGGLAPLTSRFCSGPLLQRLNPTTEAFAELTIEFLPLTAQPFEQLAITLLDEDNGLFALAQADDIFDVPGPLLLALDRLGDVRARGCSWA